MGEAATNERFRVLFVGMDVSRLSVSVFEAISAVDDFEVLPIVSARPGAAKRVLKDLGWPTLVRGAFMVGAAKVRMLKRRLGMKRRVGFRSMTECAAERGLTIEPIASINAEASRERFRAFRPDVMLVAACDQILKPPVLAIPRLGAVNVHPSLLPAHRGPMPCYWVVEAGDATTGVTFHEIDEGIDTGPILAQREFAVEPGETEPRLRRRCAVVAGEMAVDVLSGVHDGTLEPRPQPEEGATYEGKPPRGRSRP